MNKNTKQSTLLTNPAVTLVGTQFKNQSIKKMKKTGFVVMQVAIYLILLGGIGDIIYSFSVESIIPAHLDYLKITSQDVSPQLRNLDLGFMRGIGGFIIAIGIGALVILYSCVKNDNKFALWGMLVMITIGEGNNTLQMILLDSPFYAMPLFYLILLWIGAILWFMGNKNINR